MSNGHFNAIALTANAATPQPAASVLDTGTDPVVRNMGYNHIQRTIFEIVNTAAEDLTVEVRDMGTGILDVSMVLGQDEGAIFGPFERRDPRQPEGDWCQFTFTPGGTIAVDLRAYDLPRHV